MNRAGTFEIEVDMSTGKADQKGKSKFSKNKLEKKDLQNHLGSEKRCSFDDASPRMKSKTNSVIPKVNSNEKSIQNRKFISKTSTSSSYIVDELSIVGSDFEKND